MQCVKFLRKPSILYLQHDQKRFPYVPSVYANFSLKVEISNYFVVNMLNSFKYKNQ